MTSSSAPTSNDRELVISRVLNAPREKLYQAWTTPALITQWFTPPPFKTVAAELDVRAGGANCITMQSPEGQQFPNRGIFLEVVPNERLVFTDAYTAGWQPSEKPFMTSILTFEDAGNGRTLYTARVLHWTVADRDTHEKMGFHQGWSIATNQLEALAQKI